ncbi:MAG: hypothetical protein JWM96_726 [Alphaproteobacteria bacterium]|nr:hypothetical protein [Alphaproteobacteria bacterium]
MLGTDPYNPSRPSMITEKSLTILSQLAGTDVSASDAEKIFLQVNAEGAFAPGPMVASLIDALLARYGETMVYDEKVEPVFADMLARDRHTGYYIHSALRTLYLDFALTRAALPGEENRNFLVLGDYMNLSSVNDAIGRGMTNDLMATICGIYLDCMIRAGVVNWLYNRSMGDEITFIIVDTPEDKVKAGLAEADAITAEFVQALGLERLRHKKYPDQSGTGLVTAYVPLKGNTDRKALKQLLDEEIQARKKAHRKKKWFALKRPSIEPDQYHNRSSEQRVDKALHKYKPYRTAAQTIAETDNKIGPRNVLNPAKSLLVGRAIAWPRDDRIEYLRAHHDNSKIMLRADIYNLSGLNSVMGHDGADHIKAHLIRILYNTIQAHDIAEPKIFDCGGGIIDIVINMRPPDQLHRLIATIQSNIHHQILSLSVAGYASSYNLSFSGPGNILLSDLPHPRMENFGTGLAMATHVVETSRLLMEIIERLDKITHRTKMHDFAYLWADRDNQVFALKLNQAPNPVFIGIDRKNPGPHYLPFTDALRHYIRPNDLPAIFERPVGQICETLFGTDMQAVLGFKKAIRMLQDEQVSDDEIDAIQSYAEMDERLRAAKLPPLSVVSTQNRPALVNSARGSFRTMALAEKLEDLPGAVTNLILQAQASFRTLKIIQPHGHLSPVQARQVLAEELAATANENEATSGLVTETLYAMTRLLDQVTATLDRNLPDGFRRAMRDLSLEILRNLSREFSAVGEEMLAAKLQAYIAAQKPGTLDHEAAIRQLHNEAVDMVEKFRRKNLAEAGSHEILQRRIARMLEAIVEYRPKKYRE